MITLRDLEHLEGQYQLALANADKIERVSFYPKYPDEVSDFMQALSAPPWMISYRPEAVADIMKNIETANIDEIRGVLTGSSRAERFCDGAWEQVMETRMLDPVFERLRQILV